MEPISFNSVFSARLALPGPEEKRLVTSSVVNPLSHPQIEGNLFDTVNILNAIHPASTINPGLSRESSRRNCEPIIEEPTSPEPESFQIPDIEDWFNEDSDEIPLIKLNIEEFSQNLQDYVQKNRTDLDGVDFSKAMVMISQETASIPAPKLKNISRLRTEHQVYVDFIHWPIFLKKFTLASSTLCRYELPDSHYLLEGVS